MRDTLIGKQSVCVETHEMLSGDKRFVDRYFEFACNLGLDYSGEWSDPELATVTIVGTIWILFWVVFGYAHIPIADFTDNVTLVPLEQIVDCNDFFQQAYCVTEHMWRSIKITCSPLVYFMAIIAFFGWFFFVVFVGIGLTALPMDLLIEFTTRPQTIDVQEYAKQKMLLNERAQKLTEVAKKLGPNAHRATGGRTRTTYNKFKQAVYFLEKDWEKVKTAYKERGGNPIK